MNMTDPLDIARTISSNCLAMRVRLLERVVCGLYAEATAAHGVTIAQYTLLAAITRSPDVRASDLAQALVLDRSTLSRNLARLKQLGHVSSHKGRGRSLHYRVTASGEEVLVAVHAGWSDAQEKAGTLLGEHRASVMELAADVGGLRS